MQRNLSLLLSGPLGKSLVAMGSKRYFLKYGVILNESEVWVWVFGPDPRR